jgi:hypothetical protein
LPWEIQSDSRGVVLQKDLSSKDYNGLMMDELEDLHVIRLKSLENIEKNKMRVAKYYNKKVKARQFAEGDLVWKVLLPIGTKYSAFGKWSPNCEGPFRVVRCAPGNAYILKTLLGEEFTAAINGRYLKKYYPSIEVDRCLHAPGLQASDIQRQPAFGEEAAFRTKNPNRRWPILECIALSTKILHITNVSCGLLFDNPTT